MKKLLFISLFAALLAAGCSKDEGPGGQGSKIPDNEIWYTSSDGEIVEPYYKDRFGEGVEILSNTYENGKGIIKFNAPVTVIGDGAFHLAVNREHHLTSIILPKGVTEIGYEAFYRCEELTSITIPDGVTRIGIEAFSNCLSLTSITIPESMIEIAGYAFYGCKSLTNITIPDSVTKIENWVFFYCSGLTSITIPAGVTEIRNNAFYCCTGLTNVYCRATTPPTLSYDVFKYFDNDYSEFILENLTAIYVPRASVEAYKAAENWSEYADLIQPYDF